MADRPGTPHARRLDVLVELAVLAGFVERLAQLPDGSIPDVLRVEPWSGAVFLGDAKDTETPGCAATRARLLGYAAWFSALPRRRLARSVMALCFGEPRHATEWGEALRDLFDRVGVVGYAIEEHRIDADAIVVNIRIAVSDGSCARRD